MIELQDIRKTYRVGEVDLPVLKGVSLTIRSGEYVALMGSSGSGKTTLMNLLGCLDCPTSGLYRLEGVDVSGRSPAELAEFRSRQIGFVFQNFNLLPRASALDNVLLPTLYGADGRTRRERVEYARHLLASLGLEGRLDHTPNQLSGGERQRVAIARALINRPRLLLADEPTGNLDSRTEDEILEVFRRLNGEHRITLAVVTHDDSVARQADRVVHVKDGLICEDGAAHHPSNLPGRSRNTPSGGILAPSRTTPEEAGRPRTDRQPPPTSAPANGPRRDQAPVSRPASYDGIPMPSRTTPEEAGRPRTDRQPPPTDAPANGSRRDQAPVSRPAATKSGLLLAATVNAVAVAAMALRRNLLRTALTMLGVIIGVASVVSVMELSSGASRAIEETIASMGASMLTVSPGKGASTGRRSRPVFITSEDVEAVVRQCPAVQVAAPLVYSQIQLVRGSRRWRPNFAMGTSPRYLEARNWSDLQMGKSFTRQQVLDAAKVCLLGETVARKLFEGEYPIGQEVRANGVPLRVVGVLSPKGGDVIGNDQDDIIVGPWTTFKFRINSGTTERRRLSTFAAALPDLQTSPPRRSTRREEIHQIYVQAAAPDQVDAAREQVTRVLSRRHNADPEGAYRINDITEVSKVVGQVVGGLSALGLVIAGVSLVVGGVGIMNIMLVSVTERTREIGLRMAVGADRRAILRQFLIEAMVLCLLGGVVGIFAGHLWSSAVGAFVGWPTEMSLWAPLVAVGVAAGVGVLFGYYPARTASRLNPIDALRYE